MAGLYDELRPGRPRSIEDEQIAALLKRTLSRKPTAGTHWSIRQAAQASGISRSTVHRLFQTFALQPHRSRSFKLSTDLMFIWAAERFRLNLLSYECRTEGTKLIELDRTEIFTRLNFKPVIRIDCGDESAELVEARTRRALGAARKYSLVANSVKSEIVMEPEILVCSLVQTRRK